MKMESAICNQKKNYLQSYNSLKISTSIICDVIEILEHEQKKYQTVLQGEKPFDEIDLKTNKLKANLIDLLEQKNQVCSMIIKDIEKMNDETEKNILTLKYINGETWEKISEITDYSIRQIYYIHVNALKHYSE